MKSGIKTFARIECANFNNESCVYGGKCKILVGKTCDYFENCVLGKPDYPHKLNGWDYQKLHEEYANLKGATIPIVTQRLCQCGESLEKGKRYCEKCRKRAERENARKRQKKRRS